MDALDEGDPPELQRPSLPPLPSTPESRFIFTSRPDAVCNGIQSILRSAFSAGGGSDGGDGTVLFLEPHHVRHHDAAIRVGGTSDGRTDAASDSDEDGRVMVLETIIRECGLPAEYAVVLKVGCQWLNEWAHGKQAHTGASG